MKVLVTGGAGFIGSHVVDKLVQRGQTPVVLERHRVRDADLETVLGDVRDRTAVMQAVADVDAVIHLAGILGTAEQVNDPMPAVETNILGALNVFQAVRAYERPAVYITLGNHWMNNTYSISKSCSERFALMANKEWGTRIAVIRAVNAYGPRQKVGPVKKIMPTMLMAALRDEPITVYGDGAQVADMVYVSDLADALVRGLLDDHGCFDSIMEVGTGVPTTVNDVAEEIIRQVGSGSINRVPMRAGEPEGAVVIADPSTMAPLDMKAEDLVQLEEGVAATIPFYKGLL